MRLRVKRRWHIAQFGLVLACLWGCSGPPAPVSLPGPPPEPQVHARPEDNPLFRHPRDFDFSSRPELEGVIAERVYNYFRFTNPVFAQEVCRRFRSECSKLPDVNLHGDAHLEQYSISDRGYGLSDFDNATVGPPLIDVVRFGVSLHLAASQLRWPTAGARAFDAFLDAYLAALSNPGPPPPPPTIVAEIRKGFVQTREEALSRAEAAMQPVDVDGERVQLEMNAYAAAVLELKPELTFDYFQIKNWGALTTGIGSALTQKFLFVVEGPTEERDDDVILEAKVVRPLVDVPCVQSSEEEAPIRLLDSQARISYFPYQLAGYVTTLDDRTGKKVTFWLHEWETHYVELNVETSFQNERQLTDIARDVGYQLGRGHTRRIADPNEAALCRSLRRQLGGLRKPITDHIQELTWDVEQAARAYRAAVESRQ